MSKNGWQRKHLIMQFRKVVHDCDLSDLPFRGSRFTYSNRRRLSEETKCRLDMVLTSPEWRKLFNAAMVYHLTTFHSDHGPIQLSLTNSLPKRNGMFRYETMWTRDLRFKEVVRLQWSKLNSGSNMMEKLELLQNPIRMWNTNVFGNVNEKLRGLRADLKCIKEMPKTEEMIQRETEISAELNEWLLREEQMWQQRSRILWLKDGDNNTSFFHRKATARRRANTIHHLRNSAGDLCSDQASMEAIALTYFMQLFTSKAICSTEVLASQLATLSRRVTSHHNQIVNAPYTEREIFAALSQLNPFKAPGLDGFPADFFEKHWDIVKHDFCKLCLSVLSSGFVPAKLNDTLLVLIPKQKKLIERMEDLRPISLTSVASKVVAKVLVN
ncbi:hypothetical protein QQ045_020731 [Rhodiola kirilowii]